MFTPQNTALSNRGKELVYDTAGHEYRVSYITTAGETRYRCNVRGCTGKASNVNGVITQISNHEPFHLPKDYAEEIRNVRKNAKEDRKAGMSTEAVIDKHVLGAPPHLLPILKDSALRREVQRVVEVKGERDWPCTIDISLFDEAFLRLDTCVNYPEGHPNAMKIFATDDALVTLSSGLDWAGDGTFYCSPNHYYQLFVVGVQDSHLFTPLVYAFLSTKRTQSYEKVFEWLAQNGIQSPLTFSCDFERAISSAMIKYYPMATITRCWFHWVKSIYAKIQALGMARLYAAPATKKLFKSFMALSMVPLADIFLYYEDWKDEFMDNIPIRYINIREDFVTYVEEVYIGKSLPGGGRTQAMFPPATWTVTQRILNDSQLGNSTVESYNSKMKAIAPHSTAAKVAVELLGHQKKYRAKAERARLNQLTLPQQYKRANSSIESSRLRKTAVTNGPMGQSRIDHLYSLANHISV